MKETIILTRDQLIRSQTVTKQIVNEIFRSLVPQMSEVEAVENAKKIFENHQIFKWHDITIHCGLNTNFSYNNRDKKATNSTYSENDIVFIDIGIVIDSKLEGDFGCTFYEGKDKRYHDLILASKKVWKFGYDLWSKNQSTLTGEQLYKACGEETKRLGYEFVPERGGSGHPVGIFLHKPDDLMQFKGIIKDRLWILEILIHDPLIDRCAFYEDVLMENYNPLPKL